MSLNISGSNYALNNALLNPSNTNSFNTSGTSAYDALTRQSADNDAEETGDEVVLSDAASGQSAKSGATACKSTSEYLAYLQENYKCLGNGNVKIASGLLEKCLTDSAAAADFELYLKKIPETEDILAENAKASNCSILKQNWAFDKDGKISSITVIQNNASRVDTTSQLIDSLGGDSGANSASNRLLGILQAQLGANASITVKYSDSGTSAVANAVTANSPAYSALDLLA